MGLQKTWHNSLKTPIPADVEPSHVVSLLHDHGFLITMSPIVTRYEEASREASQETGGGEKVDYDVWENIGLLPGGLVKKEITFKCQFQNKDDGVVTWIQAPMGLTSQSTYTVRFREGEQSGWILSEEIDSSCSLFLKAFVEKTMVSTRKQMHTRILEKAREWEFLKSGQQEKAKTDVPGVEQSQSTAEQGQSAV